LLTYALGLGYDLYWHLAPVFNPNNFAGIARAIGTSPSSRSWCWRSERAGQNIDGLMKIIQPGRMVAGQGDRRHRLSADATVANYRFVSRIS